MTHIMGHNKKSGFGGNNEAFEHNKATPTNCHSKMSIDN